MYNNQDGWVTYDTCKQLSTNHWIGGSSILPCIKKPLLAEQRQLRDVTTVQLNCIQQPLGNIQISEAIQV